MMGNIHDQKNHDRGSVCGSNQGPKCLASDAGDSARGFGVGQIPKALRAGAGVDGGGYITVRAAGLAELSPERMRAGNGGSSSASSVHREKVGTGTQKYGILNMKFKMKTLVNAIQKGGQGKTFATCHLAFDGAARGLRVVVIDLDPQGNASFTLQAYACGLSSSQLFTGDESLVSSIFKDRDNSGISLIRKDDLLANVEKMNVEDAAKALRTQVENLSKHFDICLIDTPPFISNLMVSALFASDFVMSPFEPEPYSIQGMQKMVSVIQNVRSRGNPDLKFIGMLPNRVDARNARQLENLAAIRAAKGFQGLVMPFDCRQRGSIGEALGDQIPVWQIKKTAARVAAKEVRVMTQYVFEKMEVVQ